MLTHLNLQPIAPKRIVVLGAEGFVASTLSHQLEKSKLNFISLSKRNLNLLEKDAAEKIKALIQPEDALVIVSAIAPCKTAAQLVSNLQMIEVLCGLFSTLPLSQVIYISSDAVYADDLSLVTEKSYQQPSTLHGMMHAARELMLKLSLSAKIPLAILRPSLLYGANDPHNGYGPNRFRRLALEGKPITLFGEGEERRDHVYIEDVAKIIELTLLHRSQGVLNLATGQSLSFREVAELTVKATDSSSPIQGSPRQNPISHRHFDILHSHKAFPNFKYTSFKQGLVNSLQEMRTKEHA